MDWEQPLPDFRYVLFERGNRAKNEARFYYLGWQPTLVDTGAVVRLYGRKNGFQKMITAQPFDTLEAAWPLIRSIIKTRLRHNYRVVEPEEYCEERVNRQVGDS